MSLEELNDRIDEGLLDRKEGRVYSTEEVQAYFARKSDSYNSVTNIN